MNGVLPQPGDQFGRGVNDAGLVERPHDFMNRRSRPADRDLPRRQAPSNHRNAARHVFRNQHRVSHVSGANQFFELLAAAPGRFVQIVCREQHRSGFHGAAVTQNPQRFHGGRRSPFHIARSAPGDPIAVDARGNERQMNRIQVAVELHRFSGAAALQPDRHRRCLRVPPRRPLDLEAIARQDVRQAIEYLSGVPRPAGNRHEVGYGLHQPFAIDQRAQAARKLRGSSTHRQSILS
jgi:hypothetical protein